MMLMGAPDVKGEIERGWSDFDLGTRSFFLSVIRCQGGKAQPDEGKWLSDDAPEVEIYMTTYRVFCGCCCFVLFFYRQIRNRKNSKRKMRKYE